MLWEREQHVQGLKAKAPVLGEPVVVPWGWSVGCWGRGKRGHRKGSIVYLVTSRYIRPVNTWASPDSQRVESHDCKAL